MIVIHDTEIPSLKESLRVFKANYFPEFRKEETVSHGKVNVGVHFLVDRKGKIYSLLPTNVVGRHIVGFNHVALGIENVAEDGSHLTRKQLEADAELVEMLSREYPSIQYLIGHHEYLRRELPHFQLFKELIADDKPEPKNDPGDLFMASLRERVKRDGFEFKE
jgi:N-acetylmuramoyl-L-alanine amidase